MNAGALPPDADPEFADWLSRAVLDDNPAQAAGEGGLEPMECIPADYIRRAIVAQLDGKWVIRSGLKATRMCFTGDLHLENLEINFPLFFIGCIFEGAIHAGGVRAKTLSFTGSVLRQGADLRNARIDGHLFLRGPFEAAGPLILRDMKVDGTLDLRGGRFLNDGSDAAGPFVKDARGDCLGLSRAEATALFWARDPPEGTGAHRAEIIDRKPLGLVTLRDLKVRAFRHDLAEQDGLKGWPEPGQLILDGFTYERIDDAPRECLLHWLRLQDKIEEKVPWTWGAGPKGPPERPMSSPTPYFQLASVLEKQGRKDDAGRIRAQVRRNEVERFRQPSRLLARAFFWPVDYGASPWRALGLMLALFIAYIASVAWLDASGRMAPAGDGLLRDPCYYGAATCREDLASWRRVRVATAPPLVRFLPPDYPDLAVFEHGLEAFVPFFDFGQRQHWEAASPAARLALGLASFFGIFLGSLFAAAVSGLLMPRKS